MINLENWIRRDGTGSPTTYWGYANPGANITDKVWSIRRLISGGTEQIMEFAGNNFEFNKRWDERVSYFSAPASAVTLTVSGASYNYINLQWVHIPGVVEYLISVIGPDGKNVGKWKNQSFTTETAVIDGLDNITTYIITIIAKNGVGQTSTTVTISTQ